MHKILEFCGFKYRDFIPDFGNIPKVNEGWHYPDGTFHEEPPELDMNFFFKYVVPKLNRMGLVSSIVTYPDCPHGEKSNCIARIYTDKGIHSEDRDPNKAWQEALTKLMKEIQ